MAILTDEYKDIRQKTHRVEHVILPDDSKNRKEQIVEELFQVLTRPVSHISA